MRKKNQVPEHPGEFSQVMVQQVLPDIARAVIRDYHAQYGGVPGTLAATIEFDDQMHLPPDRA